jgi:hypothetical protein
MNIATDSGILLKKTLEDSDQDLINAFERLRNMSKLVLCDNEGYLGNYIFAAS